MDEGLGTGSQASIKDETQIMEEEIEEEDKSVME
jgi:hypothetical protein